MASTKTAPRTKAGTPRTEPRRDQQEQLPTWRNTRPRGNPDTDRRDMERSWERMEALLGG